MRHLLFVVLTCTAFAAHADIALVREGIPQTFVVTDDHASDKARAAAEVFRSFVQRITGGDPLPLATASTVSSGPRVLIGPSQAVRDLGVEVPSGFTHALKEEGYVIKTVGDVLILAGNDDWNYEGTRDAVYDALDALGCRWFFPGPFGEVIPQSKTVSFPTTDRLERPDFRMRNIWYSGWSPASAEDVAWFSIWCERNRMNSLKGLDLPGDGSVARLVPADANFDAHPDAFALSQDGKRERDMVCPTSDEAVRIAVETIEKKFRDDPTAISFGFGPPDGHPRCYCPRCIAAVPGFSGRGFGDPSLSDLWFGFANRVASEVYKDFPDRWVWTNGYANRVRNPEGIGPLSPNLGIQSAMLATCTLHRIDDPRCWQRQLYAQVLSRWTHDLNCVFVYDYDPGKTLDGMSYSSLRLLGPDMRWLRDHGVWGFWTEGNCNWFVTQLNYYVRARLMWDADADVRALVHDFCEKFYGPAARPMEKYLWTIEDALDESDVHITWGKPEPWLKILTPAKEEKLSRLMARAEALAADGPEHARVHAWSLLHAHTVAHLDMERHAADGRFADAVADIDRMLGLRDEIEHIQHGLLPRDNDIAAEHGFSLTHSRAVYSELAGHCDGTTGTLVTMLPHTWDFRTDPDEVGTTYQWYLPGTGGGWRTMDTTMHWERQGLQDKAGHGYYGKAWYRTAFDVPADAAGKPLTLTFGGVSSHLDGACSLWVWVNGALTYTRHGKLDRSRPLDIDVTHAINAGGSNTVAVLCHAIKEDGLQESGLFRRALLWSPKEK